jgi:hypothetical protein
MPGIYNVISVLISILLSSLFCVSIIYVCERDYYLVEFVKKVNSIKYTLIRYLLYESPIWTAVLYGTIILINVNNYLNLTNWFLIIQLPINMLFNIVIYKLLLLIDKDEEEEYVQNEIGYKQNQKENE